MFGALKSVFRPISDKNITPQKIDAGVAQQEPTLWHTAGADFMYYYIVHAYEGSDWSYVYGRM